MRITRNGEVLLPTALVAARRVDAFLIEVKALARSLTGERTEVILTFTNEEIAAIAGHLPGPTSERPGWPYRPLADRPEGTIPHPTTVSR